MKHNLKVKFLVNEEMVSQAKKSKTLSRKSSYPRAGTELTSRLMTMQSRPSQATLNLETVLEQIGVIPQPKILST
jgi:hypothetical protein